MSRLSIGLLAGFLLLPLVVTSQVLKKVVAAKEHTCALDNMGLLKCWGNNRYGQVGTGSSTISIRTPSGPPKDLANVLDVDAEFNHTCAIKMGGTVWCWGLNDGGVFGTGTTAASSKTPVQIQGITSPAVAISTGRYHACALLETGEVMCWGNNTSGQLGNGTMTNSTQPVVPLGLAGNIVKQVSAGGPQTCVLLLDGSPLCWGSHSIGAKDMTTSTTPIPVYGLQKVKTISAGSNGSTCAVLEETGVVYCWGNNLFGQLGIGVAGPTQYTPQRVTLPDLAHDVQTGELSHTCAGLENGALYCWGGENDKGMLGTGDKVNHFTPVLAHDVGQVRLIALGHLHSCASNINQQLNCWGWGDSGQLGNGGSAESLIPTTVSGYDGKVNQPGTESIAIGVFDWAERKYPAIFWPPGGRAVPFSGYVIRQYVHTNNYLGSKLDSASRLYLFGSISDNQLLDLGPIEQWVGRP